MSLVTPEDILAFLPHRYPFLFVDGITEIDYIVSVKGYKCVSMDEPWTIGHFPENPVFPGVYMIETLAQICGFIFYKKPADECHKSYLSKISNFKFIDFVRPGDIIHAEGKLESSVGNFAKVSVVAKVNEKKVAQGKLVYYFDAYKGD